MRMNLISLFVMAVSAGVAFGGVRVKLEDVPEPAVKTIKEKFAKAEIRYVDKEGGGSAYEFAMKEGDRQFDVEVSKDGKLICVKEDVAEDKLPAAVKESVKKQFPTGRIVETEKVVEGEGKDAKTVFEIKVKTDKGSDEVKLDANGKVVKD